jgi:hypothetical protein
MKLEDHPTSAGFILTWRTDETTKSIALNSAPHFGASSRRPKANKALANLLARITKEDMRQPLR